MTIALIGPMGAGKSSIGRRVARLLGTRFTDTDSRIAVRYGPVPDLFARLGEPGFRAIEREVVAAALDSGGVVALGGGAVLDAGIQERLAACTVVLLTVSEEAVAPRIAGGGRPLLTDGVASWGAILGARRPLYEQLADLVVDTSRRPMTRIAEELADRLRTRGAPAEPREVSG